MFETNPKKGGTSEWVVWWLHTGRCMSVCPHGLTRRWSSSRRSCTSSCRRSRTCTAVPAHLWTKKKWRKHGQLAQWKIPFDLPSMCSVRHNASTHSATLSPIFTVSSHTTGSPFFNNDNKSSTVNYAQYNKNNRCTGVGHCCESTTSRHDDIVRNGGPVLVVASCSRLGTP